MAAGSVCDGVTIGVAARARDSAHVELMVDRPCVRLGYVIY